MAPSVLCISYQKITTGNATDDSWNISESKNVQKTLALIISDYIEAKSEKGDEFTSEIPDYIGTLFDHYCSKNEKPRFDGIDQIQGEMVVQLQNHIFTQVIESQSQIVAMNMGENALFYTNIDGLDQKVSNEKVKLLFPNAPMYINDQHQAIDLVHK